MYVKLRGKLNNHVLPQKKSTLCKVLVFEDQTIGASPILHYAIPSPLLSVRQTRETMPLDHYQLSEALDSVSCDQF